MHFRAVPSLAARYGMCVVVVAAVAGVTVVGV